MPFFSPVHHDDLVGQFWNRGRASCPHDGSELDSHFHPHGTGYLLVLACMQCGKKTQVTRYSDPQRFSFRRWKGIEIDAMAMDHECGNVPACPVCHTGIRVNQILSGSLLSLECLRCGNSHCAVPSNSSQVFARAIA